MNPIANELHAHAAALQQRTTAGVLATLLREAADEILRLDEALVARQAREANLRATWAAYLDGGPFPLYVASETDDAALRERLAAERERVIAAAKARYDHEVSAVAHYAGRDSPAYDWHMTRQAAMADMLEALRALGDAA